MRGNENLTQLPTTTSVVVRIRLRRLTASQTTMATTMTVMVLMTGVRQLQQ